MYYNSIIDFLFMFWSILQVAYFSDSLRNIRQLRVTRTHNFALVEGIVIIIIIMYFHLKYQRKTYLYEKITKRKIMQYCMHYNCTKLTNFTGKLQNLIYA